MPHRSSDKYLKPYREAVQRFGPSFHATLWSSREAQQLRFDVMIEMAGFAGTAAGRRARAARAAGASDGAGLVVLDAGCGHGDFAAHLIDRDIRFKRYVGIDAVSELIDAAQARRLPNCEFRVADLIHDQPLLQEIKPDYVCISGTLNTMEESVAREAVSHAFEAANRGVVFNFLSDRPGGRWGARDIGPAKRFNTAGWLAWALDRTSFVSFTQEYLDGHDATIVMRKETSKRRNGSTQTKA